MNGITQHTVVFAESQRVSNGRRDRKPVRREAIDDRPAGRTHCAAERRVEEERSETARFANAALIINLLPLADDLERAVQTVDGALAGLTWVEGIVLINRKLQALLEAMGVHEIAADGETFDPAVHEAVAQQPGDEGKVLSVVQKGYTLGERVIRPSMVVVGKGEQKNDEATT